MNRSNQCGHERDTAGHRSKQATGGVGPRPARRLRPGLASSAWLWPAMLALVVALHGCGGDSSEPASSEPSGGGVESPPAPPAPPSKAKPPEKSEAAKKESAERPLPEDVSEWIEKDYLKARRENDPRLVEAVARLGEEMAGTDNADDAAKILTALLEKTEGAEPAGGGTYPGGRFGSYPGGGPVRSGYEEGPMRSEDPQQGPEHNEEDGDGMGPMHSEDTSGMPRGGEPMHSGDENPMRSGPMQSYEGGPGMPPTGKPPWLREPTPRIRGAAPEVIQAIVYALGANDSQTARQTLKDVIEGKFETDDDRVATLAALETLVAHLCPEYEDFLFRCLTAPQDLEQRELGGAGSAARPGRSAYAQSASSWYVRGGVRGAGKLTAEEVQQMAFDVIRPVASEQFRVRLAQYLASPQSVVEDHQLFGEFMEERRPDNVAAQLILYTAQGIGPQTKTAIEDNLLAMSSQAMGGILGIPLDQLTVEWERRPARRQPEYGRRGPAEEPGMMRSAPEQEPVFRSGQEEMHSGDQSGYEPRGGYGSRPPGAQPRGGYGSPAPGAEPGGPVRRSRYDTQPAGPTTLEGGAPAPLRPADDPDLPYRLAEKLWGSQLPTLLESRLNQAGSLESSAPLILLASTMPLDSMRSTLQKVLQAYWQEGPRSLEEAGLLDAVVVDPGFLALVKALPRKEAAERKAAPRRPARSLSSLSRTGSGRRGSERRPGLRTPGRGPGPEGEEGMAMRSEDGAPRRPPVAGVERSYEQQDPAVAWMATSEDLIHVLCERCQTAARAQAMAAGLAAPPAQGEGASHGLPFEPHQDATVVAEYHLDWPAGAQGKLSGVPLGAMKLHYVRAEQQARLTTAEGYYRRKLGNPDIRPIDGGTWIEDFRAGPEPGWKRSIDVLLTETGPGLEESPRAEVPITADILCIDIKDPAPKVE